MFVDNFDLNETVSIRRRTNTLDGYGGFSVTSSTVSTIKCAIWINNAGERNQSDRLTYTASVLLACRPSTAYLTTDFVIHRGSSYRITNIDNILYQGEMMIVSLERTDHGAGE